MKKTIYNFLLAGMFMNFAYPELQHHYTKLKFSGSTIEQLNKIDVNTLISNSEKYFDELGNFNEKFIEKSSRIQNNASSFVNLRSDQIFNTVNMKNISGAREKILAESKKHIGIPYSFGSKDPATGFDCSGYVSYVYKKSIGYTLPAGSKHQFSSGGGLLLGFEQLKPGDLMFFSHNGSQIQHVGIFIDKNHFIHAPRTGRRISIDELGRYWKQKFVKGKTYLQ